MITRNCLAGPSQLNVMNTVTHEMSLCVGLRVNHCHQERWYTQSHTWIRETHEFTYDKIIWIHSIWNDYMNSQSIWIHTWNEYMSIYQLLLCDFMYLNSNVEILNSNTWIINEIRYMTSYYQIWVHESQFMNHSHASMISIHPWKFLRIQYSESMVLNSVVKCGIWLSCKNHESDFKYEFIYELSVYEFWHTSEFMVEFMVLNKKHSGAAQYNQPKYLQACQDFNCAGRAQVLLLTLVNEGWYQLTTVLKFSVCNWIQTSHRLFSTTHWSGGRVQVSVQVQALSVIQQSLLKAIPENNRRFWLQNQWPSSYCRSPALLGLPCGSGGRAQTQGVSKSAAVNCFHQVAKSVTRPLLDSEIGRF